ncbi:GNAT family N-acetyltransferase [Blautia sp. HCP3S3_H10_1]|uniref:GNAT family N-acetyltransferase n=1 Tax=unclassified Blautia TaxID=2648079 RepID=UPI003F8FAABD|nr:GNAT family N-acetyltransferase [Clostridia bacterium]
MKQYSYITLRQRPDLKEAAAWFHDKWKVPREAYLECMEAYLNNRTDLTPNVCAVYTDKEYRCQGVAGQLLDNVVKDMKSKGITPIYLITDHINFYERYGWEFLCMVQGNDGPNMTRMYIHR